MYEIYDLNTGETIERARTLRKATEIKRDLNDNHPKSEPLYAIRDGRDAGEIAADNEADDFARPW